MLIRCNDCMEEFQESSLIIDIEEGTESCPNCGKSDALTDDWIGKEEEPDDEN